VCEACLLADLALIHQARVAADELAEGYLRVRLRKTLDLGNPRGFDRAVASLASVLGARASASDEAAVREAMAVLDVDWAAVTAARRAELIRRAMEAAGRRTAAVPRAVQAVFGDAATEVVQATRDSTRTGQGLAIAASFNALDRRIIRHVTTSQANFVRDEYGRRHEAFSQKARQIVADGLEAGLGRADLARDLEEGARDTIAGRNSLYWETVAGSFVSNGRSFAQLSAYAEAGIQRYLIAAVLDERTTEVCRFLDGKTFTVATGLNNFEALEADPDAIKELAPWVREAIDPDTGRKVLYVERGESRVPLAEVARSAMGTRDDRGDFSRALSERDMESMGISFPPYHALCRSTTVPDI
jgi:hypothetical protein